MAQLIHMRQHIKAVETIKKITHAMRLISMSTHANLSKQLHAIQVYHKALATLWEKLAALYISRIPSKKSTDNQLLIVIGSQKGLCGSFNNVLFHAVREYLSTQQTIPHIIPVGKKAIEFVQKEYNKQCGVTFSQLTPATTHAIAEEICKRVFNKENTQYAKVAVLSNTAKSFFVHKPHITQILPVTAPDETLPITSEEYAWDTDPQDTVEQVAHQYIASALHSLLLESLLAEHAARFVSMDGATRNAEKILETTRIKYNKLRQAKITKEIIELADAF